jgi:hypothetical protein
MEEKALLRDTHIEFDVDSGGAEVDRTNTITIAPTSRSQSRSATDRPPRGHEAERR